MRDVRESEAESILKEAEKFFRKSREELCLVKRNDWTRAAVGWAIWRKTLVPHQWIADQLNLKSAANASQQIRRFANEEARNLSKEIRKWKKLRNVD